LIVNYLLGYSRPTVKHLNKDLVGYFLHHPESTHHYSPNGTVAGERWQHYCCRGVFFTSRGSAICGIYVSELRCSRGLVAKSSRNRPTAGATRTRRDRCNRSMR